MLSLLPPRFLTSLAAAVVFGAMTLPVSADQRRFTFNYETTTAPRGSIEIENWVTYKHRVDPGKDFDQFDFRHELEFGITDRFQLSLYVADWSYNSSAEHKAQYNNTNLEAIYQLTNPTTSFLGSAIYGEVGVGENHISIEAKLLLQKNFGPFIAVYNAGIESEWEGEEFGEFEETVGELFQSFGVSYEVSKNFSVGAEVLHEYEMEDWKHDSGEPVVFGGPNMSFRFGRAYATMTAMFQLTDVEEEPDVQARLIVGFSF